MTISKYLTRPYIWSALLWIIGDYFGVFHVGSLDYDYPYDFILYFVLVVTSASTLPAANRMVARYSDNYLDPKRCRAIFLVAFVLKMFGFTLPVFICLAFTSGSSISLYLEGCGVILVVWYAVHIVRSKNFRSEYGEVLSHYFTENFRKASG